MTLSLITITGTFINPDGREPASGLLTATLAAPMTNANQIVPPQKLTGIMNSNGQLVKNDGLSPFQLFPTNSPGTIPNTGLTYAFVLTVDGFVVSSFSAAIPYDAPGATIDMTALIPAAVVPPSASFIPAQIGQAIGQAPAWNGTAWVPTTFDAGGLAAAEAVRAEAEEATLVASLTFISGPQVLGNTGATKTLTVSKLITVASCVLTANCALTITGFTAGAFGVVSVAQDATGGRTLTVNGTSVTIPSSANAVGSFMFWSPDGTNLYVR